VQHPNRYKIALFLLLILFLSLTPHTAAAEEGIELVPGISFDVNSESSSNSEPELATAIKVLLGLTILSLAPAILVAMTSFTRIIIVLSMLRLALGMQQTPPNTVLVSLAIFLTIFNMMPTFSAIQNQAFQPYQQQKLTINEAVDESMEQLREFMIRQTREEDLLLMVEVAGVERPSEKAEINTLQLIPAFMLSELKSAFQIGFIIFLPFVLIDLIVASVLMSMGMLMVPPMMISLPIKVLMFILIDGWSLVTYSLLNSFN
jgi:flagellar biosynthetic protein FliP